MNKKSISILDGTLDNLTILQAEKIFKRGFKVVCNDGHVVCLERGLVTIYHLKSS